VLFDSHCHLDDPRLLPLLPGLLSGALASGVTGFLVPGVNPDGWPGITALSRQYPQVLPAFGVHPLHAELLTPFVLSQLRELSRHAVAVGEIGLDYQIPSPDRDLQKQAFRAQLSLAAEAGLPVLIHCRKAFGDLLEILQESAPQGSHGVVHAFSGSPETARDCIRLGLHVSLGGSVTYRNAQRPLAVAACVPLERLLLETDAPDLAPEPHRGEVNLPCYLALIARRVAALRGLSLEELSLATTANATRLFGIAAAT
jgi:TatD DNase family protein